MLTASTKYQEQQHNSNMRGREGAKRGSDKLLPNMKEKTFKMFVLELFFWLMFNLSLFQSNVLVISSIAEGHI